MEPSPAENPTVRFRPGKKRKAYRQRIDDDDDDNNNDEATPIQTQSRNASAPTAEDDENESGETGVAAALRLRNARRGRLNGVGFKSIVRQDDEETSGERALVPHNADGAPVKDVVISSVANRFTHQTGLVADLNDRHMMEYIESRLSSRASETAPQSHDATPSAPSSTVPVSSSSGIATRLGGGQGAMHGHIMEIDLGDEVRHRNVARTEIATGLSGNTEDNDSNRETKKPRLGRDGKPRRPRNRRDSDAIKRDQLVEEILRENRLDVYEAPTQSSSNPSGADWDGAADDRLAEEFRQQFLEDVAQRQLKKKKITTQPTKSEDVLKGPKLGGSRNVRAAVRDLLLKKEKEGKK